ncbi:unnamed protein product [Durusdinium trenchii]|uniref:Uncharacterized protein n=1 Tax=Durusdinium trenchii TaxID=1381693 RepID=A0ABP0J028_9DINO
MPCPSFASEEAPEDLPTLLKTEIQDCTPNKAGHKSTILEDPPKVLHRAHTAQAGCNLDLSNFKHEKKEYRRSMSAPERLQSTLHDAGQQLESAWFCAGEKLWQMLTSSRQPQLICASFGMSSPYWHVRHVR